MADQEWYSLQQIAEQYDVRYHKIRNAVAVLTNLGTITTRENPRDNRILEVKASDIPTVIRGAVGQRYQS